MVTFKVIYLKDNQGHGNARRKGLSECTNDLVALMDSDDISLEKRFEKQLLKFAENESIDVCGGQIAEFVNSEDNIRSIRSVKLCDSDIKKDLKKRCPMNQVTVMFKKQAYNLAGGYIDWFCEEDYFLWARMAKNNCIFTNVNDVLVNVRTGLGMSARRGGWKYFKSEKKMQHYLLSNKIISYPRYLYNVLIRFFGEVVVPNFLRNKLFSLLRTKPKSNSIFVEQNAILNIKFQPFSCVMCVYGKDNPIWFDRALESVLVNQTVPPSEFILVVDGPIPEELDSVIKKYKNYFNN